MMSVLAYHQAVLAVVRRQDEHAWTALLGEPMDSLGDALLRHAYRLEPDVHPVVHRTGRRAAEALQVSADLEYFQVNGEANAVYIHQDRPVIVFQGPLHILETLHRPTDS